MTVLDAQAQVDAPQPRRQTGRARLDDDGVYLGVEVIDAADLQKGDVEIPVECDLAIGRYRWDPGQGTFVSLQNAAPIAVPVTAEVALAGLIAAVRDKTDIPEQTARWLAQFNLSIDGKGFQ